MMSIYVRWMDAAAVTRQSRELYIRVSRNYHLAWSPSFIISLSPRPLFDSPSFCRPAVFSRVCFFFPSPDEEGGVCRKRGVGCSLLYGGKKKKKKKRKKKKRSAEKRRAGPRWLSESFFKMSASASRGEVGGMVGGGWLEGVDTDERGGCYGGRGSGWSTPVAKGGKMAAHGKSMEASHCRRPRFHNPQTHPPVPLPHRPTSLCNPPHFRASRKRPHPGRRVFPHLRIILHRWPTLQEKVEKNSLSFALLFFSFFLFPRRKKKLDFSAGHDRVLREIFFFSSWINWNYWLDGCIWRKFIRREEFASSLFLCVEIFFLRSKHTYTFEGISFVRRNSRVYR